MQVSDDPRVGTELAGYRIESLLGLGGMSVVYLAEDLRLKRRVALKLLAASLAEDESFRDRFLRESELAASIDHPNIVPIYEAGTTEEQLFIAMRYVAGRDLGARLQGGRLDTGDAIGILAQVASALDAAHARGLVHRDVKPSNVLLDLGARPDGSDHAYLADFGLTRRTPTSPVPAATATCWARSTTSHRNRSPERMSARARTSIRSAACSTSASSGSRRSARARSSQWCSRTSRRSRRRRARSGPSCLAALDAVIARALAKEPEQRYATCREFARRGAGRRGRRGEQACSSTSPHALPPAGASSPRWRPSLPAR